MAVDHIKQEKWLGDGGGDGGIRGKDDSRKKRNGDISNGCLLLTIILEYIYKNWQCQALQADASC